MNSNDVELRELIEQAMEAVGHVFRGNQQAIRLAFIALLSRGHLLIEDVPGIGKTTLALAIAQSCQLSFRRIQMTSDLLPADLIGVSIFNPTQQQFQFHRGPLFSQVLLVDELNRATPKTQSALLEAMAESAVSLDGARYALEAPFIVLATQNPFEQAGTFMLPESQLDRFLLRIALGYPQAEAELAMVIQQTLSQTSVNIKPILSTSNVLAMQRMIDQVELQELAAQYLLTIVQTTRTHEGVSLGVSPRGSLALAQAARCLAWLAGRHYVVPEDIYSLAKPVLAHRLMPAMHITAVPRQLSQLQNQLLDDVLASVVAPV